MNENPKTPAASQTEANEDFFRRSRAEWKDLGGLPLPKSEAVKPAGPVPPPVTVSDFYAYMPMHQYLFVPTRELWPHTSVNARSAPPRHDDGRRVTKSIPRKAKNGAVNWDEVPISAAEWLDQNRPVDMMTWAPGEPMLVKHRLVDSGGWIERVGCQCFNLYRPPAPHLGDPAQAGPWVEHVFRVFPDAEHIIRWLAHRVQRPGEKINHALVMGGAQGIGKDTILEPVKSAVGPWNFAEVSPTHLLGRFNGFVKSVILRVSEARDLGDIDRFAFYDHMKVYTSAPPDVLRCDEKHLREHSVLNVCGVIMTTNHKTDGFYLPADDRRHYVAWSDATKDDFTAEYWNTLWTWYRQHGGVGHTVAYLHSVDLSCFDPKAPPPKTGAFLDIVDANRAPEDSELADVLEKLESPAALTLAMITAKADVGFSEWLSERKNRRVIPHRMESAGYVAVHNPDAKDGLWKIAGARQVVYTRRELCERDRIAAAGVLLGR